MRSPMLHRLAPFAIAITLVATIAGVASSVLTTELDPNDTPGELDIKRINYEWVPGAAPSWQVRTFNAWTAPLIWDRGYMFIEFDTRRTPAADFYVLVYSDGRRILGALFEVRSTRDRWVRWVDVRRPDRSTIGVRFGWSSLEFGPLRQTFRWWVTTSISGAGCPRSCIDVAPDSGGIEEWRPGMSPTPTPTPTPTPPPTPTDTHT